MTKILLQEFVAEPTCAIGQIPPATDALDAEWVIFLDGDVTNTDESNIIDFKKYQAEYTYEDYLENFEMLDRLFETSLSLQEKLKQAEETIARLQHAGHAS
jgi:hypothetical protein